MPALPVYALMPTLNAAVCTATVGLCLVFLELNRPGRILPGAAGLLLLLLSIGRISQCAVRPWAVCLLLAGTGTLLTNAWRQVSTIVLVAAALSLIAGLLFLCIPRDANQVDLWAALVCGGGIAALSAFLTRIARHARRLKAID